MKTLTKILLALFLAAPALHAAAPADIVFPPPPDAPRIRFVRAVSGKHDLGGKSRGVWAKIWAAVVGAEQEGLALARPYGLWVQGGRIFVADTEGASVVILDTEKASVKRIGVGAQERLTAPIAVAVDLSSRVFVTDSAMNAVKAYSPEGRLLWQAGTLGGEAGELKKPTGISVGQDGSVLVADTGNTRIVALSPQTGAYLSEFGKKGAGPGELSIPANLWVEKDGTVLVSDSILCRVQAFSPEGKFLFQFGECGDMAGYLSRPRGVASDSEGNIYVVDALFNAVQIFNREGKLLLFFGGIGAGPAAFQLPAGIFIDASDRVYVVDSYNRRVQIFQYLKGK
ncbi:MAG: 6-bladed beta-propeller [Elusimicrobiota bacterium]